ncbi:hypothetical protein LIER_27514 [Lithospermum erythrorhizon]|uniref:Uncharacterized protein n=1 Tax=Lithospermum erythrorhizon TaxID=34254 RepID=A0AAV3RIB3_LITER
MSSKRASGVVVMTTQRFFSRYYNHVTTTPVEAKAQDSPSVLLGIFDVGRRCTFLLTSLKVAYVLRTPQPQAQGDATLVQTPARAKLENDEYVCCGHILNMISDALFDTYQIVESAKLLWDQLEARYIREDTTRYLDASWIFNGEHSSTSERIFTLGGSTISWGYKKQTGIADSFMASEFIALASICKEVEWLPNLLYELPLWPKPMSPISLHCDSEKTLARAYNMVYNGKSRHICFQHSMWRN